MNCVEFRRLLGSEPHANAAEFAQHRAECERCADAAARAVAFDRSLLRALNVAVPAQLAESILLAQATAERRRRTGARRGAIFALAAALVLAVGVVGMRAEAKSLSAEAVAHLEKEAVTLKMAAEVPSANVIEAFAQRGLSLRSVPGGISFVGCCPMDKHRTVHMVMPASHPGSGDDPVTVIYVVDQRSVAREDFSRSGWQGRTVPLGSGTLILLARHTTQFDRVENLWRDAIVPAQG
jgi:Protein of unknown function (DUF3379)